QRCTCLLFDKRFRPIPRQEIIEPAHRVTVSHALEDVFQVGKRFDVVELCGGDEGEEGGPADAATIGAGEEMVLAAKRDGADRTFDRIVVEVDTAIVQETAEGWPAGKGVTDRFGEATAARDATKLHLEPGLYRLDEGSRLGIAHGSALFSSMSPNGLLDCIKLADPAQGFSGDR